MRKRHQKSGRQSEDEKNLEEFKKVIEERAPKKRVDYHLDSSHETLERQEIVMIRYKPIAWGFPLDEVIFSRWFVNMLRLPIMPWDSMLTAQSTYLPDARNIIHENYLRTGCEYLMMLDSDVMPPPGSLDKLLKHKLPLVGGWYRKKGDPYPPVVYDYRYYDKEKGTHEYKIREEPGKGLEEVDAAGAGCWLMHRDVAVAIGVEPYSMIEGGEDLQLCRAVRNAGFKIYIDWDIACAHTGVAIV